MRRNSSQSTLASLSRLASQEVAKRSLVQLHPLDLETGPVSLGEHVVIGRSPDCDLAINDESVSRRHAEIRVAAGGTVIADLGSTNGVVVNGKPCTESSLVSGDRIQLGNRVFRFLADDDIESQYQETVYSMMTRDGLTGVYNQRYLIETLDREVARCKRHSRPIALIMFDVDQMQTINDKHGRITGDQVLRSIAQRIQDALRRDDVVARIEGDKFAILVVESNFENSAEIAQRCRIAVESSPIETTRRSIKATISIGMSAPSTEALGSSQEMLKESDERLGEAKRSGGNQLAV